MIEEEGIMLGAGVSQPDDRGPSQNDIAQAILEKLMSQDGAPIGAADGNENEEFPFVSIAEARKAAFLSQLKGEAGGWYLRAIVDWLIDSENVSMSANHLHDFNNLLIEKDDWLYVLKLAAFSLERYPYHIDPLGDAIQAASNLGDFDSGQRYVDVAVSIPKEYWDWYLAVWVCGFYKAHLNVCEPDKRSAYLDKGLEIIRQYREHFPLDERAYNQEAEILLLANRKDEARAVLERAIFEQHESDDGTPCRIAAAQCCVTYLDMVKGTDNYQEILRIAQKGIKDAAQDKPSARVGYFLLHEALALDAKLCSAEDPRNGYRNPEQVEEVLHAYEAAYQLNKGTVYSKAIEERYTILCGKCGLADRSLPDED